MNNRVLIDRGETNPMLMGYMEMVKEDTKTLMQKQQELNQAMASNAEIAGIMQQHKKEAEELQIAQQKKISEMMAENPEIMELMEQHKKEVEELKNRQRLAVEELMKKDEDIIEAMKQQNEEMRVLSMKQQQALGQEVNNNASMAEYLNPIKAARQSLQENQQLFEQELFKATYMSPVKITPEPLKDADGNAQLAKGSQVSLQAMTLKNNKNVLVAFTDVKEFKKWSQADSSHTLSLKLSEMIATILKDPNIAGICINPFSENLIFPKERLEMMLKAVMNQDNGLKNTKVVEANINE